MNEKDIKEIVSINVIISDRNGFPCLELRRSTTNKDIIKDVIYAALHDQPVTIFPSFSNKIKSVASLVERGIIYRDKETDNFYFNI